MAKPTTQPSPIETIMAIVSQHYGLPMRINDIGQIVIDLSAGQLLDQVLLEKDKAQELELADKAKARIDGVRMPPKKAPSKPEVSKAPTSARYPETIQEVTEVVVGILKKAEGKLAADAFYDDLGPDKVKGQRVFEKHRQAMIKDGVILVEGRNRGTRYTLPTE